MTTDTTRRVARFVALPVVSAGLLAGVLGFAGAANAGTYSQDHTPRPGLVAAPNHTAPSVVGTHGRHIDHVGKLVPGYHP
ncbi:hypothetical protein [Mycolicibacterium pulveris]|uniref:hypothetical protein n=1 Tax=Mycolicibacterium pulveris TaxID=36813 RepID=UPI003CF010FE